jgi:hypothetical protein
VTSSERKFAWRRYEEQTNYETVSCSISYRQSRTISLKNMPVIEHIFHPRATTATSTVSAKLFVMVPENGSSEIHHSRIGLPAKRKQSLFYGCEVFQEPVSL